MRFTQQSEKIMKYPFKNLVFEGGGVKGIAYIGAMGVLEKKGILKNIRRVGGASAGAINALLFGLGYDNEETKEILWKLNFNAFEDGSGWLLNAYRLFNKFGWYKGNFFKEWIGGLIEKRTGDRNATFGDISRLKEARGFREISMIGTNLSTRFSEVYSAELTPTMRLVDAVRISMSIPLFFRAVRDARKEVLVDGGVLENYPVKLFDREKYLDPADMKTNSSPAPYYAETNKALREGESSYVYNKETLGFRLDSKEEIQIFRDHRPPAPHPIQGFVEYAEALVGTLLEAQASQHLHSDDWQRTIYIDTLGVRTTQFDLDDTTKEKLVNSGRTNTEAYFKWYDDPKNKPANRVVPGLRSGIQKRKAVGGKRRADARGRARVR
jgi:NTE family protein